MNKMGNLLAKALSVTLSLWIFLFSPLITIASLQPVRAQSEVVATPDPTPLVTEAPITPETVTVQVPIVENKVETPVEVIPTAVAPTESPVPTETPATVEPTAVLPTESPVPTEEVVVATPVSETPTQEQIETIVEEITIPVFEEATATPVATLGTTEVPVAPKLSVWEVSADNVYTTSEPVEINKEYTISQLSGFSITFTRLPQVPSPISVQKVSVPSTINGQQTTGEGYDVTSAMVDGSFEYTVTLPKTSDKTVDVLFSEDGKKFSAITNETNTGSEVSFEANHFTLFVVVNPNAAGNGNASNDACLTATLGGVVTCYDTIQAAINAATDGNTVRIKNGTVNPTSTVNVNKQIILEGESEAGAIIDASSMPAGSYGLNVTVSNVIMRNFTLQNAKSYGIKVSGSPEPTNISISNVTVRNSALSNIDFNGVDNISVQNVTATGSAYGVGIAVTDGIGGVFSNITTSGNALAGMAFYTSTYYPPAGVSNMAISGSNSFGETIVYYTQGTATFSTITWAWGKIE